VVARDLGIEKIGIREELKDLEQIRRCYTQINVKSLISSSATGNQKGPSAIG
jgi:hypothetical protein